MTEPAQLESSEEILDFAIQREQEAQAAYLSYAAETTRRGFSELLMSMADMEKEHERKLSALREGKTGEGFAGPLRRTR